MRILVVDDHEIVRRGVRRIVETEGWEVCGEAADGATAIEQVRLREPDVVILDITMPVMNGYEAARQMKQISPATKIVFLSMHDASAMALMLEASKAYAFVTKSESEGQLVSVIRQLFPHSTPKHRAKPRNLRAK